MMMKKLLYYLFAGITLNITLNSCFENNSVGRIVQQYKNQEILEDSLLAFLTDSINFDASLEWANNHKENDVAFFILGQAYFRGYGIHKNLMLSKANYLKAIDMGNIRSMQELAILYLDPKCEN